MGSRASPESGHPARPLPTVPLPFAGPDDATSSGKGVASARLARKSVPGLGVSGFCSVSLGLGPPPGAGGARRGGARPQPQSCRPRAPRHDARGPSGSTEVSQSQLLPAGGAPGVSCGLRGSRRPLVTGGWASDTREAHLFPGSWGQSRGPFGRACTTLHGGCLSLKSVDIGANLTGREYQQPQLPFLVSKPGESECLLTEGPQTKGFRLFNLGR